MTNVPRVKFENYTFGVAVDLGAKIIVEDVYDFDLEQTYDVEAFYLEFRDIIIATRQKLENYTINLDVEEL